MNYQIAYKIFLIFHYLRKLIKTKICLGLKNTDQDRWMSLNRICSYLVVVMTKLIQSNNMPHLLFYGPPGTGKTSAILAVSNMIYEPAQRASMVLEMNASDDRGINTVRNEILSFASS
ncbi:hypothetical protein MXB_5620, partial [Myxobolus squamalis]